MEQAVLEQLGTEQAKRMFDVAVRKHVNEHPCEPSFFFCLVPVDQDGPGLMDVIWTEENMRHILLLLADNKQEAVDQLMTKINATTEEVKGTVEISQEVADKFSCALGWEEGKAPWDEDCGFCCGDGECEGLTASANLLPCADATAGET